MADKSEMLASKVTTTWLEASGFTRSEGLGYVRELAQGPGGTRLLLCVGNYPFNAACVTLNVGGFGVVTNAADLNDIASLVRLFDEAAIDHPYEM